MPKKVLGNNGKHRANSPTSVRMLRLAKRRAEALDYRLAGDSFAAIAKKMRINVSTAHDYVVRCLENIIPKETAAQVVAVELQRYDAMLKRFYPRALKGDEKAAELVLKISNQRAKLLGIYAQPQPGVHVNIDGGAIERGLRVEFVEPKWIEKPDGSIWNGDVMVQPPDPPKQIEAPKALPQPAGFGRNVLDFRRY